MSNPNTPKEITRAVASVLHSVSPYSCILVGKKGLINHMMKHMVQVESRLSGIHYEVMLTISSAPDLPPLQLIFSLRWIYAASAPSVLSGIRLCFLDGVRPSAAVCVQI